MTPSCDVVVPSQAGSRDQQDRHFFSLVFDVQCERGKVDFMPLAVK